VKALASENHSPIQHLASILWPPWVNREKAVFAMLTFAFDAGGDDGTDFMTVAGFASSMKDWDEFSQRWKARLEKDGIEFFRAVDAASFRGPFKHWHDLSNREQLRRALFADLMELIKSHAYRKFACTIVNKDYQSTNSALRKQFAATAYSVAARTCEKYARHWVIKEWNRCPDIQIALIFEAGDQGQGELQERLRKDQGHLPANFRPKKDTRREDGSIEYGFVPLQAADWLAWELNKASRDFYKEAAESESQFRWPLQQFLARPDGYLGIYTPENLQDMDNMIELESKISSWGDAFGMKKKGHSA
jgi:hypothetical protein